MRSVLFLLLAFASPAMAQQAAPTQAAPPQELKVPVELAQATAEYLATRPYKEVAVLMANWLRLAQQPQQEKKE